MEQIWKYELSEPMMLIMMPQYALLLSVKLQGDKVCLWAMGDPCAKKTARRIHTYGTGRVITNPEMLHFIDTIFIDELVFHVFEQLGID